MYVKKICFNKTNS